MRTIWVLILFGSLIIHHCFTTVTGEAVEAKESQPSYSDCKPYVDAALKGDIPEESNVPDNEKDSSTSIEDDNTQQQIDNVTNEKLKNEDSSQEVVNNKGGQEEDDSSEEEDDSDKTKKGEHDSESEEDDHEEPQIKGQEVEDDDSSDEEEDYSKATKGKSSEEDDDDEEEPSTPGSKKTKAEGKQRDQSDESDEEETPKTTNKDSSSKASQHHGTNDHSVADDSDESNESTIPSKKSQEKHKKESKHEVKKEASQKEDSEEEEVMAVKASKHEKSSKAKKSVEVEEKDDDSDSEEDEVEEVVKKSQKKGKKKTHESQEIIKKSKSKSVIDDESEEDEDDDDDDSVEEVKEINNKKLDKGKSKSNEGIESEEDDDNSEEEKPKKTKKKKGIKKIEIKDDDDNSSEEDDYEPRSRDNLIRILGLDDRSDLKEKNNLLDKVTTQTLKELKSTYEYAIKPLETLYKYRDLSNRHFGDSEIFSKPMIVFMGPWSGGKSTIINWLLGIQDEEHALRTGADPSPAQFNIMIHGEEEEVLDGTQLAADWTFSGLQKFGQSFLDRLRGRKLPNRLLEKVNLVEIPGILEIRKQVERSFPFNDACQWFIDRADVLFLVYDPAKLDIGPETEAILDQLKGRESQVRIVLNKADSVKPDELLRVQATLIWNISPLMASAEPPVLYVASLWDRPLQPDSPTSLLNAHENLFLKDISDATKKRVETRIAAARRFAVRVRNHAKMVDCYLNTYNNHRSFFSNKKRISDDIIEHPQNYHIYEGLSTLTNISRYDLPDPDTYRDFFRLNPIWEFPTLGSTCTYFRGCPINKLDIAIAYDLPELLGRYRRQRESILTAPTGTLPDIKLKDIPQKKDEPIDIPKGKSKWYKLPPEHQQETTNKDKDKTSTPSTTTTTAQIKKQDEKNPPPTVTQPTPTKPKNKWWKEYVEPLKTKEPESPTKKVIKKSSSKKSEEKKIGPPPPGHRLIEPKNRFWKPYYEPIKSQQPQQTGPKKNKWWKEVKD